MTNTKHTPAPWEIDKNDNGEFYINAATSPICSLDGINRKANAHLIAASPDLYNAVDLALAAHDSGTSLSERDIAILRAAIAKARGEA